MGFEEEKSGNFGVARHVYNKRNNIKMMNNNTLKH